MCAWHTACTTMARNTLKRCAMFAVTLLSTRHHRGCALCAQQQHARCVHGTPCLLLWHTVQSTHHHGGREPSVCSHAHRAIMLAAPHH